MLRIENENGRNYKQNFIVYLEELCSFIILWTSLNFIILYLRTLLALELFSYSSTPIFTKDNEFLVVIIIARKLRMSIINYTEQRIAKDMTTLEVNTHTWKEKLYKLKPSGVSHVNFSTLPEVSGFVTTITLSCSVVVEEVIFILFLLNHL